MPEILSEKLKLRQKLMFGPRTQPRGDLAAVLFNSLNVTHKPDPGANVTVMTAGLSSVAVMKAFICG